MLVLAAIVAAPMLRDPPTPTWPQAFSAEFDESMSIAPGSNHGKWFYDWAGRRSRFEHLDGQHNNFCGCADNTTTAACHLFFPPDGAMWAHFPQTQSCCRVCKPGLGCSTLKPDWMSGGSFVGEERHGGRDCLTWQKPGAVALDVWSQTKDGVGCQYREHFPFAGGFWHCAHGGPSNARVRARDRARAARDPPPPTHPPYLTCARACRRARRPCRARAADLNFTNFTAALPDPALFDLPEECTAECPRTMAAGTCH